MVVDLKRLLEKEPLSQRLLGVGRLNPNVDMSYLNSVGDANNVPGLIGGGLGFLTGKLVNGC